MLGLDIAYWWTKFDHFSFSHSRDLIGAHCPPKFKWFMYLTTPLSGMICHPRARMCYYQPAYQI